MVKSTQQIAIEQAIDLIAKSYTAEFKTKVVLELLEGEMTLTQIAG